MQETCERPDTSDTPPPRGDLRQTLKHFKVNHNLNYTKVANAVGVSRTTISLLVNGDRTVMPDVQALIWRFLESYAKERGVELGAPGQKPADAASLEAIQQHNGELYRTQEFVLATGWCDFIRNERKMGAMIGHPGIGKSTIVRHYAATTPGVHLFEAWPYMRMLDFVNMLSRMIGIVPQGNTYERVMQLMLHLKGRTDVMIIIDEAEYLRSWDVVKLEILRKIWDNTGTPIILCGTPELENMLTRGSGRDNLAQLYRRKMEIKLKGIERKEAREILARYSIQPDAAEILVKVAADTTHGGMGNFCEILAMCVKAAKGQPITTETVEGAMRFKLMF